MLHVCDTWFDTDTMHVLTYANPSPSCTSMAHSVGSGAVLDFVA